MRVTKEFQRGQMPLDILCIVGRRNLSQDIVIHLWTEDAKKNRLHRDEIRESNFQTWRNSIACV